MKQLFLAVAMTLACAFASAQPRIDYASLEIQTTDLGHGVYLLGWQGGDSLILVGDDGVLLVDTAVPVLGEKIKAAIAKLSDKPIKFVVNTHAHFDHLGANELMAKQGAVIVAHDTLRERMKTGYTAFNGTNPASPAAALPSVTYSDSMTLHFAGETIQLIHVPNAHTDNDTLVYFQRANVIHASGTIGNYGYAFYDMSAGGSLDGTIAAEEKMLALADANTRIMPDEGDPASFTFLKNSHEALVTLRTRVQGLIDSGKSEDEAVVAKPTAEFDSKLARPGTTMNADWYVRMAYQSLKNSKPATAR